MTITADQLDDALLEVRVKIATEQGFSPYYVSAVYNVPFERAVGVYWQTSHDLRHTRVDQNHSAKWHKE